MEIILEAFIDSIKIFPFLFLVYLFLEYLERNTENKIYKKLETAGKFGPVIGGALGCFPQCGFSVVAANLYSRRVITLGTLLAVFISTSDEAIPILLSNPNEMGTVFKVLGLKVVIAIIVGFVIDLFIKKRLKTANEKEYESLFHHVACDCCSCDENIFKSAAVHAMKIFVYILIATLALNTIIFFIGEENLGLVLMNNSIFQPVLAALIGLIPNCAASVVLTEMYIQGSISIASLIAGLCTGAGVGLLVLFKINKDMAENIKILLLLYLISSLVGVTLQFIL